MLMRAGQRAVGRVRQGGRGLSTQVAARVERSLYWSELWVDGEPPEVTNDLTELRKTTAPSSSAAALADPIMDAKGGVHELTFAVTGDCIVGVAAAHDQDELWSGKAWGLDAPSGRLLHAPTAIDVGVLSKILASPQHPHDARERLVRLRVDTVAGRLSASAQDGALMPDDADAGIRIPRTVRPWVLFPHGHADEVTPGARLVAHRHSSLPLWRIDGLASLVGTQPLHKQALALAWCDAEGATSVGEIVASGEAGAFVSAITPVDEENVWAQLDAYWPSSD